MEASTEDYRINDDWGPAEIDAAISNVQRQMLLLDEQIGGIKTQIAHAKARKETENIRADPVWFARANTALRHKGRQRQAHQAALGELNRRRRTMNRIASDREDGRMFIACAKSILDETTYLRIWDEVRIRQVAAEGSRQ